MNIVKVMSATQALKLSGYTAAQIDEGNEG